MAPEARRERAEISLGRKPKCGPSKVQASVNEEVMSLALMGLKHLRLVSQTDASGVLVRELCWRRWIIRLAKHTVGENSGLPLCPKPITSPLTPFFCVVNVSEANVADRSAASEAVGRLSLAEPWKS